MNRRSFLLGLGAVACSGPATTTKTRPKKPKQQPEDTTGCVLRDLTHLQSQRRASRIALHGDVLMLSIGDELHRYNATTMQRTDTWTIPHRHFCFVQDGSVLTFGWERHATTAVLHRIANRALETLHGPILPDGKAVVLLAGRSPQEVYVSIGDEIYLLRIAARVDLDKILKHPAPRSDTREQLISRGDGRLVAIDSSGVYDVGPSSMTGAAIPARYPIHLAAATGSRIWYTYATLSEDWNAHTLILAPVDKPMSAETTIDAAPGRFVHIASSGDRVAALVFTMREPDEMRWSVVVYDEKGREHWRADVPSAFATLALNNGFVAIGPTRVVLAAPDGKLLAWDAASGKPVG